MEKEELDKIVAQMTDEIYDDEQCFSKTSGEVNGDVLQQYIDRYTKEFSLDAKDATYVAFYACAAAQDRFHGVQSKPSKRRGLIYLILSIVFFVIVIVAAIFILR